MTPHTSTSRAATARAPTSCRSYYEAAYADGRLRVEGDLDDNGGLRPGQCCRHFVHRHEPPVPAGVPAPTTCHSLPHSLPHTSPAAVAPFAQHPPAHPPDSRDAYTGHPSRASALPLQRHRNESSGLHCCRRCPGAEPTPLPSLIRGLPSARLRRARPAGVAASPAAASIATSTRAAAMHAQTGAIPNTAHRHSPPAPPSPVQSHADSRPQTNAPHACAVAAVEVLAVTQGIVAVNKPACMPVHVTGQYRKNTVVGLLSALRPDLGTLAPAHRLDKPVSGVLLLTSTPVAAEAVRSKITDHLVSKEYVARVQGPPAVPSPPPPHACVSSPRMLTPLKNSLLADSTVRHSKHASQAAQPAH